MIQLKDLLGVFQLNVYVYGSGLTFWHIFGLPELPQDSPRLGRRPA